MNESVHIRRETGHLFGSLWKPFDDEQFESSVGLFRKRFEANGFDLSWFEGKRCLDVGCGGGRYSIAMAREGAREVVGVDIGKEGLIDAKRRAKDYPNVGFQEASVLDLPYPDNSFDFVFCSGILMITSDPATGLSELCRVLKTGGKLYLLLYATGGVRWPAVMDYRACLRDVSSTDLRTLMNIIDFPANKIRTLMDDLKVPRIDFYHWEYVARMLEQRQIVEVERWTKARLDHEEDLASMIDDMSWFSRLFGAGVQSGEHEAAYRHAYEIAQEYLATMRSLDAVVKSGQISKDAAERIVIGQGHHRVLGVKA